MEVAITYFMIFLILLSGPEIKPSFRHLCLSNLYWESQPPTTGVATVCVSFVLYSVTCICIYMCVSSCTIVEVPVFVFVLAYMYVCVCVYLSECL